jgi:Outer membrane lipoprotein-sorting protein
MSNVFRWLLTAVCLVPVFSQDARQIIEESQRCTRSNSESYEGTLRVLDSGGKVSEKRWLFVRTGSFGNSKSTIRFTAPPEVKGVALLIVNHPDRASDQWMWTPAIERDRRIALQDRSTRFFGTDFSFEDLEERDVSQFDFKLLGEDAADAVKCWRIESRPLAAKSSQYTYSVLWIRQPDYVPARVESFIKDVAVRRLNYRRVEAVQGIATARELEMTDLRRKSRTLLTLEKIIYNAPVKDSDFTVQALRLGQ